jgi:hypothetical protein
MKRMLSALVLCVIGIGCSNVNDESVTIVPSAPAPATIVPGAMVVGLSIAAVDKRAQMRGRWWYSPTLRYAVQFEFVTLRGLPPKPYPANWQLVEVKPR